ncbi:Ribosomal protein S12 methylthiotransferase RimO [Caloramator mitchellensis]|uniref:Ribosomal protein uS12 methylthiotransferase RimO n=1 Tax=Caloramator mitchellensis TaxID=908809 RepID=A0A0R3K181_CALMK|nr:30S ribosomal protein S12 methylthiotransferase RimO [Caloramator mitchellensis]KRQ87004.1 Ribosomal protein S12 methylthiotransferase RimO [Caloramator mitchellensis]
MFNVGFISLGCDKNRVDAEIMLSILSKNGYTIVNDEKKADVIIVNTCGFIESAKMESIETILEMAKNKEEGQCKSIIVTGCMAQRYREELLQEMPEIDAILGVGSYRDICDIVDKTLKGINGIVKVDPLDFRLEMEDRILTTPSHYAYVKIAEGCNNNCSYCIIPKLRGRFRSKRIEDIITEVEQLAQKNVKEVILVAQDTTMYGVDIYGKKELPKLLNEIEKIEGIEWIRLMYAYPEEITDELIETIRDSKKVLHYFDIPIQHISDKILRKMNRRTTKGQIIELIDKIRKQIDDAVIRTSIIVGFPGETDDDFDELKEFLYEYKLERVGIFTYSPEEGTAAFEMSDQIDVEIKEKRKDILMRQQSYISAQNNQNLLGKIFDVIIDGKNNKGQYFGRTYGDAPEIDQNVFVNSNNLNKGDIVKVKINKTYTYDLAGDVYYESSK